MIGIAVFPRTGCLSSSVTADRVAPSALRPAQRMPRHSALRNSSSMVTKFVRRAPPREEASVPMAVGAAPEAASGD
jgi:hypothetical protein